MKTTAYSPYRPQFLSSIHAERHKWVRAPHHERFLFHLRNVGSYREDEEGLLALRLNYVKEGIWGKEQGTAGVWANNGMRNIHTLWPIWIDSWDLSDSEGYLDLFTQYDIWRIDTSCIGNQWYVDPNMSDQFQDWHRRMEYLYTDQGVHPCALSLYRFYIDCNSYLQDVSRRVQYSLVPERRINEFIRHKWRSPERDRFFQRRTK